MNAKMSPRFILAPEWISWPVGTSELSAECLPPKLLKYQC